MNDQEERGLKGGVASAVILDTLVARSQDRLIDAASVFPFQLFPDSIYVDQNKVTIVQRLFFWTEEVYPILIESINSISMGTSIFMASLSFELTPPGRELITVNNLWRRDAEHIRRVVSGLMVCDRERIDLSELPKPELIAKVEAVGSARGMY